MRVVSQPKHVLPFGSCVYSELAWQLNKKLPAGTSMKHHKSSLSPAVLGTRINVHAVHDLIGLFVQGIPTRAQLLDRWAGVSRAARQLSAIPQGQGGPLSIAVASLASAFKVQSSSFNENNVQQ